MKERKNNKQGISLIVLVITIIVMIILAAAVILSLSSSGIIDRANDAVDRTDLAGVQNLAATIWADAYLEDRDNPIENFEQEVIERIETSLGLKETESIYDYYDVSVSKDGIEVSEKSNDNPLIHTGKIPDGGIYYVGVTSTLPGDYTGATAVYRGLENSNGIDSVLKFGLHYSAEIENMTISLVFHTDGSFIIYNDGTPTEETPEGTISYAGTSVLAGDDVVGKASEDGMKIEFYGDTFIIDEDSLKSEEFPKTVNNGDVYVYGDYEYRYNQALTIIGWMDTTELGEEFSDGWGVRVLNSTKTTYDDILESINNKPIKMLNYTFADCNLMTKAPIIPETVTLMTATYQNCAALTSAPIIPETMTFLNSTFEGCTNLTKVVLPKKLNTIGTSTFNDCESLIEIVIPDSVTSIDSLAFAGCTNLTNFTIPAGVRVLGTNKVFFDCTSLATIVFKGTVEQWNTIEGITGRWYDNVLATEIKCSNGIVPLS